MFKKVMDVISCLILIILFALAAHFKNKGD